jgi:hypothetical protein
LKYNYVDLGTTHKSFPIGGGGAGVTIPSAQKANIVEAEISYRF